MRAYEKLGVFYLGRHHDLATRRTLPEPLLYDSNDLLTHGLCVGMTGSGKTGLCVALIEEAAMDGIPAIVLDPKGDLANLMLTFPDLTPSEFQPWISPDEARKKGMAPADFAVHQAETWREGLARWDQDGQRIARLREAADFRIYTPGSSAGLPVSILGSFSAPSGEVLHDNELLRDRIQSTVSGLLGLLGADADPTRSREAILLSNILQRAWVDGRDLDLAALIREVQTPSLQRIGVMELETFYPGKDRFELATAINGVLASPGFGAWLEGESIDIQRVMYGPTGKPRVAVFSIAHLPEVERMFFVTLLLNQLLGWMRGQTGTTSLRALLYMDEIFGYFPPVANPPSKRPLLTLLKQGRAFGLGVVLATQNPVDLDYKGLANIGTWFLGRLQTERDKERILEGLEGATAAQGAAFDRAAMERTLAGLGNRIFLMHNVHEDAACTFESRWAMSYLRGPLTRSQIKSLMDAEKKRTAERPSATSAGADVVVVPPPPATAASAEERSAAPGLESVCPSLPPEIRQFYVPARTSGTGGCVYVPMLLGAASVRFADPGAGVDHQEDLVWLTLIREDAVPVDWSDVLEISLDPNDLERSPAPGAAYARVPSVAAQPKNYPKWQKDFADAIYRSRKVMLLKSTRLQQFSRPNESERDFRVRLGQSAREQRDVALAKLRAKYAPKTVAIQERLRRAEQAREREAGQARSAALSTALSFGSTLLGAFLGRKVVTSTNLGRAATALRGVGRSVEQAQDVTRAGETVEALKRQLAELDEQFQVEAAALETASDPATERLEMVELRPSKTNIQVKLVALAWTPHYQGADGQLRPAV